MEANTESYEEIMTALAEEMDGTSRAFGDDDAQPQSIAEQDLNKTAFICQFPPAQLATLV